MGLHVRRGDSNDGQLFSLPSENYYLEGIAKVTRSIPNPRILVFTDDPAWVSRNLPDRLPGGAFLQTGSKPLEDFALMPLCEGHVTSNSGFSLMAAWVSGAPPERIAVPRRWFNNSIINYNRLPSFLTPGSSTGNESTNISGRCSSHRIFIAHPVCFR